MSINLPNSMFPFQENYAMLNDGVGNYWFHHRPSFPGSNPALYKKLISTAENNIKIWDPHLHETIDCVVFSEIKENISIEVLTQKSLNGRHFDFRQRFTEEMQRIIPREKNASFCIGVINTYLNEKKKWEFHDRFLIIDLNQVFLIGSSIEYNHTSKMGSGIYKITNQSTSQFIIELFDEYWRQTSKLPVSVQSLHP